MKGEEGKQPRDAKDAKDSPPFHFIYITFQLENKLLSLSFAGDVSRGIAAVISSSLLKKTNLFQRIHETIGSCTWKINPSSKSPVKVFDADGLVKCYPRLSNE